MYKIVMSILNVYLNCQGEEKTPGSKLSITWYSTSLAFYRRETTKKFE